MRELRRSERVTRERSRQTDVQEGVQEGERDPMRYYGGGNHATGSTAVENNTMKEVEPQPTIGKDIDGGIKSTAKGMVSWINGSLVMSRRAHHIIFTRIQPPLQLQEKLPRGNSSF